MSEIAKRLRQCRKPSGEAGEQIAGEMNESHFELTGWGLEKANIRKDGIILDVGCGGGRTVNRLAAMACRGRIFGIDYSRDCVTWSERYNRALIDEGRVRILHGNVQEIPFDDSFFDTVTAVETIYFWADLLRCFEQVKRVLKQSGEFIIINEAYESERFSERNRVYLESGDMKIPSPEQLRELLCRAGFDRVNAYVKEEKNWLCCIAQKQERS